MVRPTPSSIFQLPMNSDGGEFFLRSSGIRIPRVFPAPSPCDLLVARKLAVVFSVKRDHAYGNDVHFDLVDLVVCSHYRHPRGEINRPSRPVNFENMSIPVEFLSPFREWKSQFSWPHCRMRILQEWNGFRRNLGGIIGP